MAASVASLCNALSPLSRHDKPNLPHRFFRDVQHYCVTLGHVYMHMYIGVYERYSFDKLKVFIPDVCRPGRRVIFNFIQERKVKCETKMASAENGKQRLRWRVAKFGVKELLPIVQIYNNT